MAARLSSAARFLAAALALAAAPVPSVGPSPCFASTTPRRCCARMTRSSASALPWTFDEMYSASLFSDYTSRPKGALTPADIVKLRDEAFKDSVEEHYFTDIVWNGKALPVTAVTDFSASYDGRKMTYRFTVPLDIAPVSGANTLDIDSFDREFYIDFEPLKRDPVGVGNGAALQAPLRRRATGNQGHHDVRAAHGACPPVPVFGC